jgi:hypothetical protein
MAYIIKATFTKSDNKLWPWEEGSHFLSSSEFTEVIGIMKLTSYGSKFFDSDFIKSPNLCEFELQFDTREDANKILVDYMTQSSSWVETLIKSNYNTEYTDWKFKITTLEA